MSNIHYVYRITNLKNNKIYIGVRTHPNPELDSYMSSSTIIEKLIQIEGIDNFKKEVIHTYTTRQEAEHKEKEYLTEEFCNDPNTYNVNSNSSLQGDLHGFRKDLWYDYYDIIREKYQSGESCKELGKFYKCDTGTIRKIVEDIKRTRSETQILRYEKFTTSGARDLDFDKEHLDELIKLYVEEKWSVNRIAMYFGKNCPFVDRRLAEHGIPKRKRSENLEKPSKKDRPDVWEVENKIISLYEKGYTTLEIGKQFNTSTHTIGKILKTNNITLRKRGTKTKTLCQ